MNKLYMLIELESISDEGKAFFIIHGLFRTDKIAEYNRDAFHGGRGQVVEFEPREATFAKSMWCNMTDLPVI